METKIKTFEAACAAENVNPGADMVLLSQLSEPSRKSAIANYKLDIVIAALNNEGQEEPWKADYSDRSQIKYEPRFFFSPGSGWSYVDYVCWRTLSHVGARRVFRSYDVMRSAVDNFMDLYAETL